MAPTRHTAPLPTLLLRSAVRGRRWAGAAAAVVVTLASWAGAAEAVREPGAPLPVSQALRALARLVSGRAGSDAVRAASRRALPMPAAGRQPSELRRQRETPSIGMSRQP